MSDIHTLKKQLVQAEQALQAKQEADQLATFAPYAGKVYAMAYNNYRPRKDNGKSVVLTHYKKVYMCRGEAHYDGESVAAIVGPGAYIKGVQHTVQREVSFGDGFFARDRVEVSAESFKKAKAYAKSVGERLLTDIGTVNDLLTKTLYAPALEGNVSPELTEVHLDIPHIQLERGEVNILGNTPFTTVDNKYLISPASLALADRLVGAAESDLWRCSDLFQECDMRYVNSSKELHKCLRSKLRDCHNEVH